MSNIEQFIKEYDCSQFNKLPKFIKRRVDALKKIQLEHIKIQHQYNKRLQELELEFDKLHKPLYEKRAKIISGDYEPSDEDCKLPDTITESEMDHGDQENAAGLLDKPLLTEEEEKAVKPNVKGIPGFWLGCIQSTYSLSDSIEDHDKDVLRHLKDIKLSYDQKDDFLTYKLEFVFEENPYFTNEVLSKTYYLRSAPDEKNPFSYDGFEVFKSEGCEIDWKPGKDITTKTITVKQQNKNNGKTREKKKEVERDSFFYFFKPPQMPEGGEDDIDDELGTVMALDFELGELIRQSIIPKAALYYSGYMDEEDDDDDEDDEDDDDSDGLDYDSDLEESDESTDSLAKKTV